MNFYSRFSKSENTIKYGYITYPLNISNLIIDNVNVYFLYLNENWESGEYIKIPIAYEEDDKKTILFKINKPLLQFNSKKQQEEFEEELEIEFEKRILFL